MKLVLSPRAARPGRRALFAPQALAGALLVGGALLACASSSTGGSGDGASGGPAGTATSTAPPTSTGTSKPPPPVAVTPQAACVAYAKALCAKQKSCNAFQYQLAWGEDATCEARRQLGCTDRFSEPGVTMKPEGLDACAKAVGDAACGDFMLDVLPAACTLAGTLDKGAACAHDEQCATAYCKKGSFGACGACGDREKEGGSCSVGLDCTPGLVCASQTCRAPAAAGASCSSFTPCAPGLVCKNGVCGKGSPAGASCGETPDEPDPCDRTNGVVCSALLMSCVQAKVVPTGGTCNPYQDVCASGGDCDGFGANGTCLPPLKEGDDCQVTSGPDCLAPSVCDLGKCVVPSAAACKK